MSESDPYGKAPGEPGAKLDQGKIRVSLTLGGFSRALEEVCKVGTFGACKYSDNGWMEVPDGKNRYADAAGRHLLKSFREEIDKDSGCMHKAQKIWNDLAELELILREREKSGS